MAGEAVKKFALVPADMVSHQPRAVEQQLTELDAQMQKVLHSQGIPADIKLKLYGDALARFNVRKKEVQAPIEVPLKEVTKPAVNKTLDPQKFLRLIPSRKLEAAEGLLDFLNTTQGIRWSSTKELLVDGRTIPGSNAYDLFDYAIRDKAPSSKPAGWDAFRDLLHRFNVPNSVLSNRMLKRNTAGTRGGPRGAPRGAPRPSATPLAVTRSAARVFRASPQSGRGRRKFKFDSLYK